MRILFFLRSANLDRLYEPLFSELVTRGHAVTVVVERDRALAVGAGRVLDRLGAGAGGLEVTRLPELSDRARGLRGELRSAIDFLRYLEPEYRDAPALVERARQRAPRRLVAFERHLASSPRARRRVAALLRRTEAAVPIGRAVRAFVAEKAPDVVLVAPLVSIGSSQADWIRIASELGVPSVLPVASWDNLTNKGLIKRAPTATVVWNEAQASEAVEMHGIPAGTVVVSGAHPFDPWFERVPSVSVETFKERTGLPSGRPYFLYVGSSRFIAGDETDFVREWICRVRGSDDASVRGAGILVRPHPLNAEHWGAFVPDAGTVVWPPKGTVPTDDATRADYYDSLAHATAVVGINTSALVEAAIVRRPSLTVLTDRFRATQEGTLHFGRIRGEDGVLVSAPSWEAHLRDLAATVLDPGLHGARIERFLRSFLRPRGLERPAAPVAAEAVEAAAGVRPVDLGAR